MKPILLFAFLVGFWAESSAQDPRFSQYYAAPWSLNPAMTGLFNGRWRATVNYRDQWGSVLSPNPFRTYAAAADMRFNTVNDDYFALGLGVMHDEAGTARYSQNTAQLGGAFLKRLSGGPRQADHYLSLGAQVGMGQHSLDWGRLWFSRQYDPVAEAPDYNLGNGEATQNGNTDLYLDFNAGLLWYAFFGENGGFAYLGGAMQHVNQPNLSFTDDDGQKLYSRWSMHGGGQFPISTTTSLLPGIQVMRQGPAFETDLGFNLRYSNNDLNELALRAGAWGRMGNRLTRGLQMDAITVVGMVELNRVIVGLSYDITVSSLSQSNSSRGAFEVSMTYIHPGEKRSRVVCPTF